MAEKEEKEEARIEEEETTSEEDPEQENIALEEELLTEVRAGRVPMIASVLPDQTIGSMARDHLNDFGYIPTWMVEYAGDLTKLLTDNSWDS